jgi:hypothetical protein
VLHGVLDAGGDEEFGVARIGHRPGTNVGDNRVAPVALDAIDPDSVVTADVAADQGDQHVGTCADERHVHRTAVADGRGGSPVAPDEHRHH